VAPYFLEELPHLWSVRGFCEAEFNQDHRSKGDAICEGFLNSVQRIRDADEVTQVVRNIARHLAMAKRSHIKRVWQQCYDDIMAIQSETRLKTRQGAQQNFERAATLTSALNEQIEGESCDDAAQPDSSSDENTPFALLILDDNSDSEYSNRDGKDEDSTASTWGAFEKPPEKLNWLVGPGESSSRLKTEVLWKIENVNISQDLADRRSEAMLALELLVDPDILALRNFIYTPKVLQDVLSIDHWTEATESWQMYYDCKADEALIAEVASFAFNIQAKTTRSQAIAQTRCMNPTNPLHQIIENYLRTSALWSRTTDDPEQTREVNEDTFINDFVKPVMDGYTVAIMEVKAPDRRSAGYRDDRRKLYDQMKLSVDGLLSSGINMPVVGFLVSGALTIPND
ncbi:hypothetical protein BGW38_006484, partial [Lunasporangiospora selenospora]